jgi:hypothetical protein
VKLFAHAPVALRRTVADRRRIEIRHATGDDVTALGTLGELTDRPVPAVPLLVAEADGAVVAAVSRLTGEVISDPFVATEDVVALLRLRAAQLDAAAA